MDRAAPPVTARPAAEGVANEKSPGIEPGGHGVAGAERNGVRIIRDFFPTPRLAGRFAALGLQICDVPFDRVFDGERLGFSHRCVSAIDHT